MAKDAHVCTVCLQLSSEPLAENEKDSVMMSNWRLIKNSTLKFLAHSSLGFISWHTISGCIQIFLKKAFSQSEKEEKNSLCLGLKHLKGFFGCGMFS